MMLDCTHASVNASSKECLRATSPLVRTEGKEGIDVSLSPSSDECLCTVNEV